MRFVHELTYDGAPGAVAAMLGDAAFREKVCEYQQVLEYAVQVDDSEHGRTVSVDQVQQARGLPAYATAIVGDRIEIEQRETWRTPTSADLELTVPGRPARMVGAITLRAEGARTVETVSGELTVSVPLVGGRIEAVVADILRAALDAEQAVGAEWLARG